ncbi:MAG TPA: hypothetical protein PLO89_08930 [Spirochaetota bacterium]|nr:hypothetical protein [Spirochaetota bacterium]
MNEQTNDIEKLKKLREQIDNTYKTTTIKEQKERLSAYIREIDAVLKDIESGNWVNPVKLSIISEKAKIMDIDEDNEEIDFDVEELEIIEGSKDVEMNTLYSYYKFFEDNFLSALNQSYLKLDYNLGKKRDDIYIKNDVMRHLIEEYSEDMKILFSISNKEQSDKYRERLSHQKKYLFIKLSEFLRFFLDFLGSLIVDLDMGRSTIFNQDERFLPVYSKNSKKNVFYNRKYKDIIYSAKDFIEIFIEVLRLPDFKRK